MVSPARRLLPNPSKQALFRILFFPRPVFELFEGSAAQLRGNLEFSFSRRLGKNYLRTSAAASGRTDFPRVALRPDRRQVSPDLLSLVWVGSGWVLMQTAL